MLEKDFTTRLPSDAQIPRFLRDIQTASAARGVLMMAVASNSTAAAADRLGREEVKVTLRGGYGATKRVLRDVSERHDHALLSSWTMRRQDGSQELQSDVAWLLLSRADGGHTSAATR